MKIWKRFERHRIRLIQATVFLASAVSLSLMAGCGAKPALTFGANASSFDFGQVVVTQSATRDVVTLTNNTSASESLAATITGDPSLQLVSALSCESTIPAGGVCSMVVSFTPSTAGSVAGSLSVTLTGAQTATQTLKLTGTGVQLSGGESLVTATANPVVALYTYQPDVQGSVAVQFGTDTTYGRSTSSVSTPSNGNPVSILVAGMEQNTLYHMQAVVTESDGTVVYDQDHTFTTTSFPTDMQPQVSATTTPGQTPQPGIELMDAALDIHSSTFLEAFATDLQGNLIWGYNFPDRPTANTIIQPIKLLPNGNFLVVLSFASQFVLPGQTVTLTPADESVDLLREIDLAGDPVEQLTLAQLNAKLAAAGYTNMTLTDLHHDVTMLPNGHIILIANMLKSYSNLTGYPGSTNVLGDVLVDVDPNFNVTWVWSSFDHLDVNRHPIGFPDWTHTNTVIYSPDDGNLLISMRHQSWIIKIDYENGAGSGDILWKLGNDGDFTLSGGTAPEDWFYGQHQPSFVGTTTSGIFQLTMMDNGYGRYLANGSQCTSSGAACYTTVPIITVNESAKTAAVTFRQTVPANQFSVWGGNAEVLANGDLEYDLCSQPSGSQINEITTGNPSQLVWSLTNSGSNLYRGHRLPSLYPGVQW